MEELNNSLKRAIEAISRHIANQGFKGIRDHITNDLFSKRREEEKLITDAIESPDKSINSKPYSPVKDRRNRF